MLEKLKELIKNYVEVDDEEIVPDARFSEDLGFNSYDFMCMLGDIEDEMDIEVNEEEASASKTVKELVQYLEEQQ
ncbi:MAG: acyl carrier protein [Clostridia bacterium]|nr:acyl carrier protein [Clostridia bacterium]